MTTSDAPQGPLVGIRILELTNVIAGPTCCQILGDFGADIVKIEHPKDGDGMRRQGAFKDGEPLWWKMMGRNKRSMGMYLGDPAAAELFCELVKSADVVVEGFRPGTLEKWNLGYDRLSAVNPRIILARLSGFGQEGPYATRPAFGTMIESMTGFAHLTGQADGPPTLPPMGLADSIAGIAASSAIMMALYHRDAKGGSGQVIDMTVFEPMMSIISAQIIRCDQLGLRETRTGNRSVNTAPRNTYVTRDRRWIGLAAATNETAARVMRMVGRPELAEEEWFKTGIGRVKHVELIDQAVGGWIAARTRDEVVKAAEAADVTLAPVYDIPELLSDEHITEREMIVAVDDEVLGPVRMPNLMFRFSRTPGRIRWTGPRLGSSTDQVLGEELGAPSTVIDSLRKSGAVL